MFNGITFAYHWVLYFLLIIPLTIVWYIFRGMKVQSSVTYSSINIFKNVPATFRERLRHIPFAVRLIAIGLLIIALARPQSFTSGEALAAARPDLELHWVVQERFAPLLENLPWLAAVIRHERGAGVRGFVRTARQLRRQGYAYALDLQGNAKSALLARASGAGRVVGIRARELREGWSATLLHQRVPAPGLCHPAASPWRSCASWPPEPPAGRRGSWPAPARRLRRRRSCAASGSMRCAPSPSP